MITAQDIEKLANLARVKVDENEKARLVKEIDSILAYVDQIQKATIAHAGVPGPSGTSAEDRIGAVKNVVRPDEPLTISAEDRERILAEAPDREGDFVAVKKIL